MTAALEAILSRPRTVLTMMLVMILAGAMAYVNIPKEAEPDIDVPVYFVSVFQQGVSPGDAERLLVRPLESKLRGISGLKEITTIASQSSAVAVLEFTIESEKDKVLADIRDKVDQAKAEMPADADEPVVAETNFALKPTIIVTLSGNVPERTLYQYARRLKDEIEAISSVQDANLSGNREEMLEVVLDLARLESYDITQAELLNSLAQNNQLVAAGFIDDGSSRFNLKVPGLVEDAQDVYSIPIKQNGEAVVTLGDVAEIRRTFKDPTGFTRVNGQPAIALEVVKRIGKNVIENNRAVRDVVENFSKEWPSAIKINFLLDQSSFINEVQGSLQASIMTAISLVLIVVVFSLGLRSGLLVGLSVPISFTVGFMILGIAGMTVNMMVLFGMVLTVGMLVDGAIVVTEYADRKLAEGMDPAKAYTRAAQLMFWPVVSSTATTLAAFLPLLLWPGVSGEFMSYLPIMVIVVLSASLMTALIFLPTAGALTGRMTYWIGQQLPLRRKKQAQQDPVSLMFTSRQPLDIAKVPGVMGRYLRMLKLLSGNLIGNIVVVGAVIGAAMLVFGAFGNNSSGVEFFVDEEPDVAVALVSARGNLSASQVRDLVGEVERRVLNIKGVENVVMTATASGGTGGSPLDGVGNKPPDTVGQLQIDLADFCCRRRGVEIFKDIRQATSNIPGIRVEVRKIEGGPPTGKDLRLQIASTDYDAMTAAIARVRAQVDTMQGLQDIEDGRPLPGIEWELSVNREEAGRFNAGIVAIGSMVQLVSNGVLIGKYRPDDSEDELDIRVRLPEGERSFDTLDKLKLRTANGQVPLSNFVERTAEPKISSIVRRDGLYTMDVQAGLIEGYMEDGRELTPKDKVDELRAWMETQDWPASVTYTFRGGDEEEAAAGEFLGKAAMMALFLMFIILVTQFNSFYQSVLTLSTVVLAVLGVLIGLMVTGQKFSIIMTGTGVVALAGIVVNNAIVLIDTYNRLRAEGVNVHDAVLKTAAQRLRPIMLTTITTIMGLIPMALQINMNFIDRTISYGGITSVWWVQLSTAVISGLAFSTLLTLIVIPSLLAMPANLATIGQAALRTSRPARREMVSPSADSILAVHEQASVPTETPEPDNVNVVPIAKKPKAPRRKKKKKTEPAVNFTDAAE